MIASIALRAAGADYGYRRPHGPVHLLDQWRRPVCGTRARRRWYRTTAAKAAVLQLCVRCAVWLRRHVTADRLRPADIRELVDALHGVRTHDDLHAATAVVARDSSVLFGPHARAVRDALSAAHRQATCTCTGATA